MQARLAKTKVEPFEEPFVESSSLAVPGQGRRGIEASLWFWDQASGWMNNFKLEFDSAAAFLSEVLESRFGAKRIPFHFPDHSSFLMFLLGPHSLLPLSEKEVLLSLRAGPDVYRFNIQTGSCEPLFHSHAFTDYLYASTPTISPDMQSLYTARWSIFQSPTNEHADVSCQIIRLPFSEEQPETLLEVEAGDFIHQVALSPDGRYLILAEMGMYVDRVEDEGADYDEEGGKDDSGSKMRLKGSRITLVDLVSGFFEIWPTPYPCPAHVEFDPDEPEVFYLSCHNIGLHEGKNILFGPGAIVKIRIHKGRLLVEGVFQKEGFFRITTHVLMMHRGRKTVAVTVFPNGVQFIDAEMMTERSYVELYPLRDNNLRPFHPILPDDRAPFSLCTVGDGERLILNGGNTFYAVDMSQNEQVIQTRCYNSDGNTMVGGHMSLIR